MSDMIKPTRLKLLLASALSLSLTPVLATAQMVEDLEEVAVEVEEVAEETTREMGDVVDVADADVADADAADADAALEGMTDSIELPAQAVSEDTMAVLYVDTESLTADDMLASVQAMLDAMPAEMGQFTAQIQPQLRGAKPQIEMALAAFKINGGQGLVFGLNAPAAEGPEAAGDEGDASEGDTFMLIKLEEGRDGTDMINMFTAGGQGDPDALKVAEFAPGWLVASSSELVVPEGGNEELAQYFGKTVSAAGDAPVKFSFRVTDGFREEVQRGIDAPTPDPEAARLKAKAVPMLQALQNLRFGNGTVELGANPAAVTKLHFSDEETAEQFIASYRATLTDAEAMITAKMAEAQQQGVMPIPVDAEMVRTLLGVLQMEQEGNTVVHTFDKDSAGEIGKAVAPIVPLMLMMMGGMGG